MRITPQRMIEVLGNAPKPESIWQRQFDGHDDSLVELAAKDWDKIPRGCLRPYILDMAYVELQPNLFRYIFPVCLKYWYETLLDNVSFDHGDANFHFSFKQGKIGEKMLSEKERQRLWSFFSDGMIDRLELQNEIPQNIDRKNLSDKGLQAWIWRFNTLGKTAPIIKTIWEDWWSLDHVGKAICATLYSTGLIYLNDENPIYSSWTYERGGGGPYLTENDAELFHETWQKDNRHFLSQTLSAEYICAKLDDAVQILEGHDSHKIAEQVAKDAKERTDIISIRIADLIEDLAKVDPARSPWR